MRVGYGAVSFISKYEGKYYKEGTDNNLCIRTPSGSTGIDDSELIHNDDDQRRNRYDEHEGHGE